MKKYFLRIITIAVPAAAASLCAIFSPVLIALGDSLPKCFSRSYFNIWCPACGNTRAVQSLLRGDLLASLRYNITPFVLIAITCLFWAELILRTFGKKIAFYPRRPLFSYLLVGFMLFYYVIRNFIPFLMPA